MKFINATGKYLPLDNIDRIIIYGHGEKLVTIDSGNIKQYFDRPNHYGNMQLSENQYTTGAISAITLYNPVKDARKENLTRKDNYTLRYTPEYLNWERRTALYIHESEIAVDDLGDRLALQTEEEKNYLHAVNLRFTGPVTVTKYHAEKIPCEGSWTLPEGARWSDCYGTEEHPCFDTYDNSKSLWAARHPEKMNPTESGVIKRWTIKETIESGFSCWTCERYYTKTEYSADRMRKNAIADALNASGLFGNDHYSHYDIDKLEKVLGKLTLKEAATA